jgi:hypothetical protein
MLVLSILIICEASAQTDEHRDADYQWVERNIQKALDDLLPMDSPDSNGPEQESITFRYVNSILTTSREYSFSLIRRSYERPGPLVFYWVARVHMADGASIRAQLEQLHTEKPDADLAGIESQVKTKAWSFDEKSCPALVAQATKFQHLSFKVPFKFEIITDQPSFEFRASSLNASMRFSTGYDRHPLPGWAMQTRRVLAQCGATESAPLKDDYQ